MSKINNPGGNHSYFPPGFHFHPNTGGFHGISPPILSGDKEFFPVLWRFQGHFVLDKSFCSDIEVFFRTFFIWKAFCPGFKHFSGRKCFSIEKHPGIRAKTGTKFSAKEKCPGNDTYLRISHYGSNSNTPPQKKGSQTAALNVSVGKKLVVHCLKILN